MQLSRRHFVGAALVTAAGAVTGCVKSGSQSAQAPIVSAPPPPVAAVPPPPAAAPAAEAAAAAAASRDHLPPLIQEALAAMDQHAHYLHHRDRIGVADFSLPSSQPRFHLVNAETGEIEQSFLVAHGSGSDRRHTGMLQTFSNQPGSNATSRGAYLTAHCYQGKYGRSQRLLGLDPENNMAFDRAIVIHGAPYVEPKLIRAQGRIGRSQGCFAFEHKEVAGIMDALGEGRMIYASKLA